MASILVVDDEASQRSIVSSILSAEKHTVHEADGVDHALEKLEDRPVAVVLTDLKMRGRGGLDRTA